MNSKQLFLKQSLLDRTAKRVGVFCNARDEKNIKEWAAHHLLIGFDYVIIYDHKSIIPLSQVFSNFDKRVIVIRKEMEGGIKMPLMNNAIIVSRRIGLDWFIYLDADEFLILNNRFKGVKQFLNTYLNADSVGVNWLMFGSNNLIKEPDGLILENYTKSALKLNHQMKSFVRTRHVINSVNPHYYNMRDPRKIVGVNFKHLTCDYHSNKIDIPYDKVPAYIAHYVYQSEETYMKRKIKLNRDDTGGERDNMGKRIHNFWNDRINTDPQKYVEQIKSFLSYYDTK